MSDLNNIFGYTVYKPPPEQNLPMIADLNVYGEVVTLIDPSADVIKDPAVQKIFKNLDGERTVKIEDLAPDVRYDGWNKKAQYDKQVIVSNAGNKINLQPQLPVVNQNLLKENQNSQQYQQEALKQAQLKALNAKNNDLEFARQLQETRIALEKEITRQLVEQLTQRAQKQSVTPEQQALIEKLYLDLRLINPELAFNTLKAFSTIEQPPIQAAPQQQHRQPPVQQQIPRQQTQPPVQQQIPRQHTQPQQRQPVQQQQQQQQQQPQAQSRTVPTKSHASHSHHHHGHSHAQGSGVNDEYKSSKIRSSRR